MRGQAPARNADRGGYEKTLPRGSRRKRGNAPCFHGKNGRFLVQNIISRPGRSRKRREYPGRWISFDFSGAGPGPGAVRREKWKIILFLRDFLPPPPRRRPGSPRRSASRRPPGPWAGIALLPLAGRAGMCYNYSVFLCAMEGSDCNGERIQGRGDGAGL